MMGLNICFKEIICPDWVQSQKRNHSIDLKRLTLKVPITTAAEDIRKYFFHCFSEKIRLDVASESSGISESSARQRIHMKNQALLSSKDKSKKLKCHLLQFSFGASRVNNLRILCEK